MQVGAQAAKMKLNVIVAAARSAVNATEECATDIKCSNHRFF